MGCVAAPVPRGTAKPSVAFGTVSDMENKSDLLALRGTMAWCPDCRDTTLFVPVDDGCGAVGCEFCCTACDAAVFLFDLSDSSHQALARAAG